MIKNRSYLELELKLVLRAENRRYDIFCKDKRIHRMLAFLSTLVSAQSVELRIIIYLHCGNLFLYERIFFFWMCPFTTLRKLVVLTNSQNTFLIRFCSYHIPVILTLFLED